MAKQYEKQHIVPKRYLDRFTFNKNGVPVIGVRIIKDGKAKFFTRPTKDVGYQENFYDVEDKEDPKYWEHFLNREFDVLCGKPLENIICKIMLSPTGSKIISEEEKDVLGKIITAQLVRVPENINYFIKKQPEYEKAIKEDIIQSFPKAEQGKLKNRIKNITLDGDIIKQLYLNKCFDDSFFKTMLDFIKDRPWVVYINTLKNKIPFITSDNPVVVYDPCSKALGLINNGLAGQTITINFAITPSIAIQILSNIDPLTIGSIDGKKFDINDANFIYNMNCKVMEQAYAQTFLPETYFKCFEKVQITGG